MNTPLLQFPIIAKLTKYFMCVIIYICQYGGIGRRTGLKIQRWQHRAGSTPAAGIMIKTRFLYRPQKVRPKNLTFWRSVFL